MRLIPVLRRCYLHQHPWMFSPTQSGVWRMWYYHELTAEQQLSHSPVWCKPHPSAWWKLQQLLSAETATAPLSFWLVSHRSSAYITHSSNYTRLIMNTWVPSVLWRCWLDGRKGIQPVKNWLVGCLHGYLSGASCRFAHGPADATATYCLMLQ